MKTLRSGAKGSGRVEIGKIPRRVAEEFQLIGGCTMRRWNEEMGSSGMIPGGRGVKKGV